MMAEKAIAFLQALKIPEGPQAGEKVRLAGFQRKFVAGALDPENMVACLSIGRGNGKTALSAGLALGTVMGIWDKQPRREILLAARNRDQAKIAFYFASIPQTKQLPESPFLLTICGSEAAPQEIIPLLVRHRDK